MHATSEMRQLSALFASAVFNELAKSTIPSLPDPSNIIPQVFPVRMEGNTEDPPMQIPHIDGEPTRHPLITSLYYAHVEGITGGSLLLHENPDTVTARIVPQTDNLTAILGNQLHSVEPLTKGTRITVVTNFYADS
ncbi:2OG-Fe(II) oxygenase [Nocardia wallacei]|uniref:2OG-Fe(II) oxygenase n=1 Tax=Nocardia wallacei TaxID=480035 RepID=UPI0024573395|nr:2OG-Fe(II) oxygenase [Nocardia wallacei]